MSKREEELEKRVNQLEDVCSDLLDILDNMPIDWDFCDLETIADARAAWLQGGELEEEYDT